MNIFGKGGPIAGMVAAILCGCGAIGLFILFGGPIVRAMGSGPSAEQVVIGIQDHPSDWKGSEVTLRVFTEAPAGPNHGYTFSDLKGEPLVWVSSAGGATVQFKATVPKELETPNLSNGDIAFLTFVFSGDTNIPSRVTRIERP